MSQGSELCSSRMHCIIGSTDFWFAIAILSPKHNTKKCINAVEHNK